MAGLTIVQTDVLDALFVLANKILASMLHSKVLDLVHHSEIPDQENSSVEISTAAFATTTPTITDTTVTSVLPQIPLPIDATGSHLHQLSGPAARTPL